MTEGLLLVWQVEVMALSPSSTSRTLRAGDWDGEGEGDGRRGGVSTTSLSGDGSAGDEVARTLTDLSILTLAGSGLRESSLTCLPPRWTEMLDTPRSLLALRPTLSRPPLLEDL